ncbi:MAG: hypothetical protein ACRYGR_02850 [Janthinobacterium lividum]
MIITSFQRAQITEQMIVLKSMVDDILIHSSEENVITIQSLQSMMSDFEQKLNDIENFAELEQHLEKFQTILSTLIQRLEIKRDLLQDNIKSSSNRTRGINAYTSHQNLSSRKIYA